MMRDLEENKRFEWVVERIEPQGRLLRVWELEGGVSALVTGLEVEGPDGRTKKMIVRQHGEGDLKRNPQVAADEFRLLQLLDSEGVATPKPYYLDQSGEIFSTPYVVIEYIEGETEFALSQVPDLIPQFTTQLASIHQVDCAKLDVSFLPQQAHVYAEQLRKRPAILDESLDEGHIRDVLEVAGPLHQRNRSVLLHGDFWPGNILWKDGRLVGVIDWEDAASGDPLADVANSRLEVLWAFGSEAMHDFTRHYQAMSSIDFANLPYWDLFAALRPASRIAEWAGNAHREKIMREGHQWFITQAFERLAAQAKQ